MKIVEAQARRPVEDRQIGNAFAASKLVARDARERAALARLDEIMRGERLGEDWRARGLVVIRIALDARPERPAQLTAKIKPPAKAVFPRHRHEGRVLDLLRRNGLVRDRHSDTDERLSGLWCLCTVSVL